MGGGVGNTATEKKKDEDFTVKETDVKRPVRNNNNNNGTNILTKWENAPRRNWNHR